MNAANSHEDSRQAPRQAHPMILTEYGLHFVKDGDHWRCVEHPDLVMLRGERYRVGERIFGSLDEALRHLDANRCSARAPVPYGPKMPTQRLHGIQNAKSQAGLLG